MRACMQIDQHRDADTKHGHTWAPEKDELKVVFETPGVEHTLPEYRGSKSHRKE